MADTELATEREVLNRARFLGAGLEVVSYLLVLATLAWAIERFWTASQAPPAPARATTSQPAPAGAASAAMRSEAKSIAGVFLTTTAILIASWGIGLAMWALAELVRRLDNVHQAIQDASDLQAVRWSGASQGGGDSGTVASGGSFQELATLMREVRDISLLNESQRAQRLEVQGREAVRRLEAAVPALLREHNWVEARRQVQTARERFPSLPQWQSLEQQIEQARTQLEARDVDSAARQVNDLVALGAWDRVVEVLQDLLQRHPQSAAANELSKRIMRERDKAEAESRARLMAQAQQATSARDWNAAYAAAGTLVQRYPRSMEAEALRTQMAVLRENAEIQTRQRMEAEIRDLVKQHQYDEALRLARNLIDQYPNSPQAQVLREQYPRLVEKAAASGGNVGRDDES